MNQNETVQWHVNGLPKPQGSVKAFQAKGKAYITSNHSGDFVVWRNANVEKAERVWEGKEAAVAARIGLVFTLPRPKSQPKYMRHFGPHWKRPDIDKLARAILDALVAGGVLVDDSAVWSLQATKYYETDGVINGDKPGVQITVTPTEIPVSPRAQATPKEGASNGS